MIKLSSEVKWCQCRKSYGRVIPIGDNTIAEVNEFAVVIGLSEWDLNLGTTVVGGFDRKGRHIYAYVYGADDPHIITFI